MHDRGSHGCSPAVAGVGALNEPDVGTGGFAIVVAVAGGADGTWVVAGVWAARRGAGLCTLNAVPVTTVT